MLQAAETTNERVRALLRALTEHADLAAQASRRARTAQDRIAHAEIESLLRDAAEAKRKER
ncbi:hypothetical protein EBZ39_02915 [bacterium]|nr:hypothetical protein [bacterium]